MLQKAWPQQMISFIRVVETLVKGNNQTSGQTSEQLKPHRRQNQVEIGVQIFSKISVLGQSSCWILAALRSRAQQFCFWNSNLKEWTRFALGFCQNSIWLLGMIHYLKFVLFWIPQSSYYRICRFSVQFYILLYLDLSRFLYIFIWLVAVSFS